MISLPLLFASLALAQSGELPLPVLQSPAENAEFHHFPRDLSFKWNEVPGAESYTLQIDCDQCCGKGFCSDISPDRVVTIHGIIRNQFRFGDWYGDQRGRWRVWANAGFFESPKSAWRVFSFKTTSAEPAPPAPTPISPVQSAVLPRDTSEVTFEWSPVTGARSYFLELDRQHICGAGRWCSEVGIYNVVSNIPVTQHKMIVPNTASLRWRVWAVSGDRRSLKSPWSMFAVPPPATVNPGTPPPAVQPLPGKPQAPSTPSVIVTRIEPEYSPEARAQGLEGTVTVAYQVDYAGIPIVVRVIQGLGLGLDEMAAEAVRKWRFSSTGEGRVESAALRFQIEKSGGWHVRHTAYKVARLRQDTEVVKPTLTHYQRPDAVACPAGERSLVTVNFHLDRKGVPNLIRVDSQATEATIRQSVQTWRFEPARADGDAREADAVFTLQCNSYAPDPPALRVGGGVTPPSVISKVDPEYSAAARRIKMMGDVTLQLVITEDGFADHIRVTRGLETSLDMNAMEAVRQWRFRPAQKAGVPVPAIATIVVNFRLL